MAEIIIIRESDLDNNTIKVVGGKVAAPGAEIEVLDNFEVDDTDTHYHVVQHKYLKHVQTGAVWQAGVVEMRERGATVTEHFTSTPSAVFNYTDGRGWFESNATSAVDGKAYSKTLGEFQFADYASGKDFNEKHAGQKLQFTVEDRFSEVGDKPKVLGTTVEVDYPQLPFTEGTAIATLGAYAGDPNLAINYDDRDVAEAAKSVEKTVHYKITMMSGRVYEGTKKFTGNNVTGDTLANDIDYYGSGVQTVEYSVDPFKVTYFFVDVTVAPEAITREIADHL